jgi:hypothetical protein
MQNKRGHVVAVQIALFGWMVVVLGGCASSATRGEFPISTVCTDGNKVSSHFEFEKNTFAYANELVWEYRYDSKGNWTTERRVPKPNYWQHCFVVARSARQFFLNARFEPTQPAVDDEEYRRLVRAVVRASARRALPEEKKIVIPGYADLRAFSTAHEAVLKAECGGAWRSYVQRGHWRMIFPFTRGHQQRAADQLWQRLGEDCPAIVHLVRFPQLTINHAVVIYEAERTEHGMEFTAYDPNDPKHPTTITYDRAARTFSLAANDYFPGGRVDVYEIYHGWNY